MYTLSSISIFQTKIAKTTPIDILIPMLSDLRLKMNFNFYSRITDEEKEKVLDFLFNTLHSIWCNGPTEIKIPAAYTVGHLLVNFGPFIYEELLKSLISAIRNYNSTSILYFSCFCYLSKFFSPKEIETYTKNINILNLISITDAGYLPKMTKELFGLPNQMLYSLAERYISFLNEDPDNKNILQSTQTIISQNPDLYINLIKEDMPLEIITTIFSDNIPILNEKLVQSLSNSALQAIQDFGTPLKKFSSACKLLNSFISHNQLPPSIVHGIFTKETISEAVSLEDLLLLPIEPSIVMSIYGNQNEKTNLMNSGVVSTGSEDSQISLINNSNPNISNVFGTNDFNSNNIYDQDDISFIYEDGSVQISIPGAPMEDISFLPSLPLPDYAENTEETKTIHTEKQPEKVTSGKAATKFDADSPDDMKVFIKSNSFSDLENLPPPPSIPSILGGSESPLQPSLLVDNHSNDNNSNINSTNSANTDSAGSTIPKKTSFGSPPFSERPSKRLSHRLSLDLNSNNSYSPLKIGRNQPQKIILQLRLNPKFVVPLINYFKRYPEFKNEFYNLILYSISLYKTKTLLRFNSLQTDNFESSGNLTVKADAVYSALKAVSETHSKFQPTELNNILEKIFDMVENSKENDEISNKKLKSNSSSNNNNKVDITLQIKILELIGTLNVDRLTKKVANKMFNLIETASVSKIDILRKKAKKSFTLLTNQTSTDLFKFFFDMYIQKLDLFDNKEFPYRLSFIAYVMIHLPNQTHVSFCSIATLLHEALLLYGGFHRNVILDMFQILSVLAPSISNPQILIVFIQHAVNIIKKNYTDYTGISPYSIEPKYPFFNNHFNVENTLVQLDTDLISNPSLWHRKYLKCARVAYSFLAKIPWDKFDLNNNDKRFIEILVWHMSMLLLKETSTFLLLLRDSKLINPKAAHKTIINLNKYSRRKDDVIAFLPLYRFICKKNEKYKQLNTDSITNSLTNFLPRLNDITNDQAISIKLFFTEKQIDASNMMKKFEKALNASVISTSSSEISHLDSINKNENEEEDETINDEGIDTMMNDQELTSFIISLTPLVYANLDVPPEFLQPYQIQSFCNNSTSAIDEDQCNQLFEFALSNSSPRVLCCVIRYALRMHYKINVEDNLKNPIFNSKKLFSCVFSYITNRRKGFQNLSKKCNQYIKQFYPNGLFAYVLNASDIQRTNAIKLMQFDPPYFINQYLQLERFTNRQLINICIYMQSVKFPKDSLFKFVIGLLSQSTKNQSQINIVRRILSVFVSCFGSNNKRAAKQIYDIIACELGFPSPLDIKSPYIQKLTAADLVEFSYSLSAISLHIDCKILLDQLLLIYTKSVPSYYYIIDANNNKKGSINDIQDCQTRILPSIRSLNIFMASKFIRNNSDFNVSSDFINNIAKLFDLFVPLPIQNNSNNNNNRILNDDTANCFFCFAMCALSHELNSSAQKTLYNLTFDRMPFELSSYSIARFNSIFKGFLNQRNLRNDILNDIFQRCCAISDSVGSVRPFFIDLFSTVAKTVGKMKIFCDKMINVMVNKLSYDSPEICENAATELMRNVSNVDEADNVLPFEIRDFFFFFIAISSIEKKNRSMVHTKLQKRYKGTHLLALKMLKDPKFRIFSPLMALIEKDIEIPPKLKDYLGSISDKIQRIYSTDTYHEF